MDPLVATAFTLVGIVVGAILSAGLEEWRTRSSEKRAASRAIGDNVAQWHLERLRQTRRQLDATVTTLEAMASGNLAEIRRGQALSRRNPDGNLALVADIALQREVHDLFVYLNYRAGRGLEPEDLVRRVDVMGRVSIALDGQEQRVLKGDAPLRVSKEDAPDLFDAYKIAARMDAYAVPAGVNVRIAMWLLRQFFRRRNGSG
jgi:hypothetical protein